VDFSSLCIVNIIHILLVCWFVALFVSSNGEA